MKKRDVICKEVKMWDYDNVIEVWNNLVNNDNDKAVYSMEMLNEILEDFEPLELLRMEFRGRFNPNDNYFCINGSGKLYSFDYPLSDANSPVDINEIIDFIIKNWDSDTPEIENDVLFDAFIEEYYGHDCDDDVRQRAEDYVYKNDIDLLKEDWGNLFNAIQQWGVEE